jgi:uncharacterized membrane-anchored protein
MRFSFRARFVALVGWQLLLLLSLMASRWTILARGTTVLLSTIPMDPRELFRGDYVALRYSISSLDLDRLAPRAVRPLLDAGNVVYVVLSPSPGGARLPWQAVALLEREPTAEDRARYDPGAVFIRGKVTSRWKNTVEVRYGIESYFVPEGEGWHLERAAGKGLIVEVKVDPHGRSAIHRLLLNGKPITRSAP